MSNSLKTWFYLLGLTVLLMYGGSLLGGRQGMLAAFTICLVLNVVAFFYADKIMLWTYGARPLEGTDPYGLQIAVAKLAENAGIPKPQVFIIPSETPNAFATGRSPKRASLAVTEGLVNLLSKEEMEGVLAHELSHVRQRDTFMMSVSAVLGSLVMYVVGFFRWLAIFGRKPDPRIENPVAQLFLGILSPLAAFFVQLGSSRNREFQADGRAVEITQNPQALANALWKIHNYIQAVPMPATYSTAHLFIVSPLHKGGGINSLFRTHPPIEERIKKLIGRTL
jgi:heat shock protein HtpX